MIHPFRTLSEPVQVVKNFGVETGGSVVNEFGGATVLAMGITPEIGCIYGLHLI
jgi:hypothetical protein